MLSRTSQRSLFNNKCPKRKSSSSDFRPSPTKWLNTPRGFHSGSVHLPRSPPFPSHPGQALYHRICAGTIFTSSMMTNFPPLLLARPLVWIKLRLVWILSMETTRLHSGTSIPSEHASVVTRTCAQTDRDGVSKSVGSAAAAEELESTRYRKTRRSTVLHSEVRLQHWMKNKYDGVAEGGNRLPSLVS